MDKALNDLMNAPEGMMLMVKLYYMVTKPLRTYYILPLLAWQMMNLTPEMLKPMIKPFVISMAADLGPHLAKHFDVRTRPRTRRPPTPCTLH